MEIASYSAVKISESGKERERKKGMEKREREREKKRERERVREKKGMGKSRVKHDTRTNVRDTIPAANFEHLLGEYWQKQY